MNYHPYAMRDRYGFASELGALEERIRVARWHIEQDWQHQSDLAQYGVSIAKLRDYVLFGAPLGLTRPLPPGIAAPPREVPEDEDAAPELSDEPEHPSGTYANDVFGTRPTVPTHREITGMTVIEMTQPREDNGSSKESNR